MATEININIRNNIDVTNNNNPTTTPNKQATPKASGDGGNNAGINFEQAVGIGLRFANAIGVNEEIDLQTISKISHYGFATAKALSGISKGSYGGLIMLAVELAVEAIATARTNAKEIAAAQNAVDAARIRVGIMDIDNCSAKVNFWSGRVTYSKLSK